MIASHACMIYVLLSMSVARPTTRDDYDLSDLIDQAAGSLEIFYIEWFKNSTFIDFIQFLLTIFYIIKYHL